MTELLNKKERKQTKIEIMHAIDSIHYDIDCAAKGAQTPNFVKR